jgi:hypothetical protein
MAHCVIIDPSFVNEDRRSSLIEVLPDPSLNVQFLEYSTLKMS